MKRNNLLITIILVIVFLSVSVSAAADEAPNFARISIFGGVGISSAIDDLGLMVLGKDEVAEIIEQVVVQNSQIVKERGMASFGKLMGLAMKRLKGRADGKLVSGLLKNSIMQYVK